MCCELTLHTGLQDSCALLHINWFNENMRRFNSDLEIVVQPQDYPRTIDIKLDDKVIATINEKYYDELEANND